VTLEQVVGGSSDGMQKVVLVVSNDPHLRAEILAAIEACGHRAHCVTGAAAARGVAAARVVNLALVDAHLPDGDGVMLGQQLASEYHIPFLQCADGTERETLQRAIAAGALNVLLKPVGIAQLRLAVDVALVRARENHKLERTVERLSADFNLKKIVSIAVGMAMARHGLDEAEAFEMVLFAARGRQQKLADFCRLFVDSRAAVGLLRDLGTVVPQQA
jgi:AmiR/NasT family two-component response regulator